MARAPRTSPPDAKAPPARSSKPKVAPPKPRTASRAEPKPPAKPPGRPAPTDAPPRRSLLRRPATWILLAALAAACVLAFDLVQAEPQPVAPDLVDGDWIVIDRLTPELHSEGRPSSSLALLRQQDNRQAEVLGRIVAWDGDTVAWKKGALTVNGEAVVLPAPLEPSARIPDNAADLGLGQFLAAVTPAPRPRAKARRRASKPAANGRPRALGLPTAEFVVPRHHLYVLMPSEVKAGAVRGYVVPQGDIMGLARIVLTNTRAEDGWYRRLMSLPGRG